MQVDQIKELLNNEGVTLVVVKNGQVVFQSHKKGILPLYELMTQQLPLLEQSDIGDTVVGQTAARFYQQAGIKSLYTPLISEQALEILKGAGIKVTYDQVVANILNRRQDDLCPIEKMGLHASSNQELLDHVAQFIQTISGGKQNETK